MCLLLLLRPNKSLFFITFLTPDYLFNDGNNLQSTDLELKKKENDFTKKNFREIKEIVYFYLFIDFTKKLQKSYLIYTQ